MIIRISDQNEQQIKLGGENSPEMKLSAMLPLEMRAFIMDSAEILTRFDH